MRLPWADCPLTAIDLADNIPDCEVPELNWLAANEGKVVKLVGQWWDTLSEEDQRGFLVAEQAGLREKLDAITEALRHMAEDTGT
jgi:hypothetical protein